MLDAGEGKTFADVAEIGLSCVGKSDDSGHGDKLYIFGSNEDIAAAISSNSNKDLMGNDFKNFTQENLGISITEIRNGETAFYQMPSDYVQSGLKSSYWSVYPLKNADYRYLYIGTLENNVKWRTDEMKFFKYDGEPIMVGTQQDCTVTVSDNAAAGSEVTVTVTANDGFEFGKLNVSGVSVSPATLSDDRKTATYTISSLTHGTVIDAWADPAGRLSMNELSNDEFAQIAPGITVYNKLPDIFKDGNTAAGNFADFGKYPTFTVCDAGEGNKYNLTKVITYARASHAARAHLKIYATNTLDASMFNNANGANGLTALTQNNSAFFGTGLWTGNNTGGTDSVRGEYNVDANPGYRYIIIASDNRNMLSLSELKIYGEIVPDAEQTYDSDYFGFTASADQFGKYNKIAIQLDNDEWKAADWVCPTIESNADVKYAIRITDVPQGTVIKNIRLYDETAESIALD